MNNLQQIVGRMAGVKILVVGDAMVDQYNFGRVTRISQEAPVPVFVTEREEQRPGGAANVSEQLQALGCDVTNSFALPPLRCLKRRWIQGTHQLFREDTDRRSNPGTREVLKTLGALGCDMQALLLSDYGKGWLSAKMCTELIGSAQELKIPVVVDPKGNSWAKYTGASVICPNREEFYACRDSDRSAFQTVLKCGPSGLKLLKPERSAVEETYLAIPAQVRHVYDVTGAGDTVTALIAAGLAVGACLEDAARIANIAAGWVVGEVGTACIDQMTLSDLLGGSDENV